MADGSGERWSAVVGQSSRPHILSDGLRANRHLRARCDCCGRREAFVPTPDVARLWGHVPLIDFADRLRCPCGARRAFLELWTGLAPPSAPRGRIFLFR